MHQGAHDRSDRTDSSTPAEPAGPDIELAAALPAEVAAHVVDPRAEWRWSAGDSVRMALAGLTLLIGGFVASRGVPSWEEALFLKVNGLPDALYPVLWGPMQLGNVWVATAAAALAGLLVRRLRSAAVLVAVPVVAWLAAKVVKAVVDRGRPAALGLPVIPRGAEETGLGFISGHATVAFALAGALAAHLRPPWRAVAVVLAVLVGVARVYVGVHLPLDVVGGAACGLLIGEAARVVELRAIRRGSHPDRRRTGAADRAPAPLVTDDRGDRGTLGG